MTNLLDLNKKVVLVTGASRGIGQAIAHVLGQHQAIIIGTATSDEGAEQITAALRDAGLQGKGVKLQLGQAHPATEIEATLKAIEAEFGDIQIVVNNAGITRDNLFMRMKDDEWETVINTNLSSIFYLCRAVIRKMIKARAGRIINVTSIVGVTGNAGQTNYSAAKAGLIGFSKSLAQEVAGRHVTVNCVAPGFIDTDMTRALNDTQRAELLKRVPAGRLGSTDDIANAVLFLASDAASYINGITLHVNGGMFMN